MVSTEDKGMNRHCFLNCTELPDFLEYSFPRGKYLNVYILYEITKDIETIIAGNSTLLFEIVYFCFNICDVQTISFFFFANLHGQVGEEEEEISLSFLTERTV